MGLAELAEELNSLSEIILDWDAVIQIGYLPSPDSLVAASIIARTLIENDLPFSLFQCSDTQQEIKDRQAQHFVLLGHDIDTLEQIPDEIEFIAICHNVGHEGNSDEQRIVNIHEYGFAPLELTISAATYLLCEPFNPVINRIIYLPLVAQQLIEMKSKPTGLHKQIHEIALEDEFISEKTTIAILGSAIYSINEALVYSQDPFLPNLTDNDNRVTQLLAKADIVAETSEGYRKFSDLDEEELKRLNIALVNYLTNTTGYRDSKLNFIARKTVIEDERGYGILQNTWDYARAIQDAINRRNDTLALTVLLGNRSDKFRELTKIYKEERQSLTTSFNFLLNKQEEIVDLKHLRYMRTDRKISWYNASLIAAMVLAGGIVTVDLPFAAIVPGPDDEATVGIRATIQMDLDRGLKELVQEVLDERELESQIDGSSHKVQFTIPPAEEENILLDLNTKLGEI